MDPESRIDAHENLINLGLIQSTSSSCSSFCRAALHERRREEVKKSSEQSTAVVSFSLHCAYLSSRMASLMRCIAPGLFLIPSLINQEFVRLCRFCRAAAVEAVNPV